MGKTLYQCRHCQFIWDPMCGRRLRCGRCDEEQYYEALDTWCFGGNEIAVRRLRNVVLNLTVVGALCLSYNLGLSDGKPWGEWWPGCKRSACL